MSVMGLQFSWRTALDLSMELLDKVLKTVEAIGKLELQPVHEAQKSKSLMKGKGTCKHNRYLKKPDRPFEKVRFDERLEKR